MRFRRGYRIEPFVETGRKRAACARSQRRERELFPLLAPLIAAQQPSIDAVMAQRAIDTVKWQQRTRDKRAADWKRARAKLAGYGANTRAAMLDYWNRCKWPADPGYLLDMMHMFDTGRLKLD
ncbi:MAG: hypothetical protein PHI71_10540 [Acidiphilium sp.]|nr:hypothetical protein [Acidiphilium sp.]